MTPRVEGANSQKEASMRAVKGRKTGQKGGGTHDVSLKVRDGTEPRALPLFT